MSGIEITGGKEKIKVETTGGLKNAILIIANRMSKCAELPVKEVMETVRSRICRSAMTALEENKAPEDWTTATTSVLNPRYFEEKNKENRKAALCMEYSVSITFKVYMGLLFGSRLVFEQVEIRLPQDQIQEEIEE